MNRTLKVVVDAEGVEKEVTTLQELYDEIRMYDPDVFVVIRFAGRDGMAEHTVSATVDP